MTRILVVDDDPSLQRLLTEVLGAEGWTVDVLGRGAGVMDHLTASPVDALVLDLVLPDGDGLGVLRQIRHDPRFADLPVVLLTGRTEADDREAGLTAGADFYITKPFDPDFLVATLGVVVAQSDQAQITAQAEQWGELASGLDEGPDDGTGAT